jgi:hypothetical protein
MSEPEKDPPDEQWLNDFMGGQDEISRAYRNAARETPPPEIDDAVIRLAQQEDALRRRMGKDARGTGPLQRLFLSRRLQWPFALAATVVLAFSAIMALREDHGARTTAMLPPAATPSPEAVAPASAPATTPMSEADGIADAPAPAPAPMAQADPGRSRSRTDYESRAAASGNVAAAPPPAAAHDELAATSDASVQPSASKPAEAKSMQDAAPGAAREVPQRTPLSGAWAPDVPASKLTASEPLSCPGDVANCNSWKAAQRTLETVYARDEARRARCFNDQCPIGSTITAAELPQVAAAFTGESSAMKLRGRWQTDLVAYAFSERYLLERRTEDDGSLTLLLRKVRYHPIGEGIEVLQDSAPEDGPIVILRVKVESSRSLRLLDAQVQPHGALVPAGKPVERWLEK